MYVLVRGLPGEIARKTEETIASHIEFLESYECVLTNQRLK